MWLPFIFGAVSTIERITQAKAELVQAFSLKKGLAVLNGDDPRVSGLASQTKARQYHVWVGERQHCSKPVIFAAMALKVTTWTAHIADPTIFAQAETSYPLRLTTIRQTKHSRLPWLPWRLAWRKDWAGHRSRVACWLRARGCG